MRVLEKAAMLQESLLVVKALWTMATGDERCKLAKKIDRIAEHIEKLTAIAAAGVNTIAELIELSMDIASEAIDDKPKEPSKPATKPKTTTKETKVSKKIVDLTGITIKE